MNNGRVLAVDYGTKRIGLALSDALRITAQPYRTLERSGDEALLQTFAEIAQRENVSEILIGLPKRLDGSLGDMAKEAKAFGQRLKELIEIPVRYWDERFSTHAAERALLEGDASRKKRKQVIDKTAAAWILQGYLDSQARG